MKLLNDWVLVELEPENEFYSGLSVKIYKSNPDSDSHVFRLGRVLQVGPGRRCKNDVRIPMFARVGSRVIFIKFIATHTKSAQSLKPLLPENQALIRDYDILAEVDEGLRIEHISQ